MEINKDLENCAETLDKKRIIFLERKMGIKFPTSFLNVMRKCNGGVPTASDFEYIDAFKSRKRIECIGSFLSLTPRKFSDFYYVWQNPSEFFPEGLIAFAETGGGDYICFDYRQGKDNTDPPIVYWNHEADVGKDVSFIANSFENFLGMLREPEDE